MTRRQELALIKGLREAGILRPHRRIEIQLDANQITGLWVKDSENRNNVNFTLTNEEPITIIG